MNATIILFRHVKICRQDITIAWENRFLSLLVPWWANRKERINDALEVCIKGFYTYSSGAHFFKGTINQDKV